MFNAIFKFEYHTQLIHMSSFEDNAMELAATVREIKIKRHALAQNITEEKEERDVIQEELGRMQERKREIEALVKNYQSERNTLSSMIS